MCSDEDTFAIAGGQGNATSSNAESVNRGPINLCSDEEDTFAIAGGQGNATSTAGRWTTTSDNASRPRYTEVEELPPDHEFFTRSQVQTRRVLTYAQLALIRMDQDEFDSRPDNCFHHTPYGLGIVCKDATPFVKSVLSCYIAGVYNSDTNRLRKAGFAQINKLKSTMMNADNLFARIGNQVDYHVSLFKQKDAHFLGFLLTANRCAFIEGHAIDY